MKKENETRNEHGTRLRSVILIVLVLALCLSVMAVPVAANTRFSLEGWREAQDKWMDGLLWDYNENDWADYRLQVVNYENQTELVIRHDYQESGGAHGFDKTDYFWIGEIGTRLQPPDQIDYWFPIPRTGYSEALDKNGTVEWDSYMPEGPDRVTIYRMNVTNSSAFYDQLSQYTDDASFSVYWKGHLAWTGHNISRELGWPTESEYDGSVGWPGYEVTYDANEDYLGASYWTGASLHVHTSVTGNQDVPIKTPPTPLENGCLEVTKSVNWGDVASYPETFTIEVTNTDGYYAELTFDETGGSQTLYDLIPGTYTVTEVAMGDEWSTGGSPVDVTVSAGETCAYALIENTFVPGCLEITKVVDWGCVVPDESQEFTVNVTGPEGYFASLTFGYDGDTKTLLNLTPGEYFITEEDPGCDWTVDINSSPVMVNPGEFCAAVTVTNTYQPVAIGDYVWNDLNANGIQDAGELGIPGVTVELYQCGDATPVSTTTTDANGYYLFDCLKSGDYYVTFILPEGGWVFSPQDQGMDDALDSDADRATGMTICTSLECGETDLTWDAGMYMPGEEWCGLTIGFWKNNVGKFIGNKKNGRQVSDKFFNDIDEKTFFDDIYDCGSWDDVYKRLAKFDASSAEEKAIAQMFAMKLTSAYSEGGVVYFVDYSRYPYDSDCYEILTAASDYLGANPMYVQDLWSYVMDLYDDGDYSEAQELADCINNYKWGCEDYDENGMLCIDDSCTATSNDELAYIALS